MGWPRLGKYYTCLIMLTAPKVELAWLCVLTIVPQLDAYRSRGGAKQSSCKFYVPCSCQYKGQSRCCSGTLVRGLMTPPVGETYQLSWKEFKSPQYDSLPRWLKEDDIIRNIISSGWKLRTYLYKAKEDALVAYLNHPNRVASCDASAAVSVLLQQRLFL